MLIKKPFKKGMGFPIAPYYKTSSGGSYTGPGDVAAIATYFGLRGVTAAYSTGSNPAVDLVDQAGANPITVNILSSGDLDIASINAWVTAHTVTTILVVKLYEQVGGVKHVTATGTARPSLILNAVGSTKPAISFNGTTTILTNVSGTNTLAQPFTISAVYERTGNFGDFGSIYVNAGVTGMLLPVSINKAGIFAGTSATATATDSAFHAVQGVLNSAASSLNVDNTLTSGLNAGTSAWSSDNILIGANNAIRFFQGLLCETFARSGADSGSTQTATNANQHAYWGF